MCIFTDSRFKIVITNTTLVLLFKLNSWADYENVGT